MSAASVDDPFLRRELRGFPLLAARVAAGLLGALALFLFIWGIPGALARASARAQLASTEVGGAPWFEPASVLVTWMGIAAAMVWCALAG
jgi:hypothetical protein